MAPNDEIFLLLQEIKQCQSRIDRLAVEEGRRGGDSRLQRQRWTAEDRLAAATRELAALEAAETTTTP